ncbi:MAG: response regulator transcription factor [Clostridia bacterium]|nr:response regulator transcription factor [Clostridia bacterium]
MIKIAIVEDEKKIADNLVNFLHRYANENLVKLQVKHFPCTTDFLTQYDGFDIVFMDIEFKNDINGIEASRKLRKLDSVVTLIFVTAFEQFAVKGYEVLAFDFIVKPILYSDFSLRMTRVLQRVSKEVLDTIGISVKGSVKIVSVKDIKYIEVIKHKLIFHTVNEVFEGNGSLNDMERQLISKNFVRCNHCYLVNLWYVKGVEGFALNLDGEEIAISRSKKKEFMSALNRYLAR